ncbi:hypothetical protein [uncultured Aquabacterium sp.]|uniref:hypothetical protein n=1 Tax=uncultured Aquabacterium sp. TaxID=158753 RepID=UPI0026069C60|nr:hypothetical protein [uncultured Aquabacterium sp.]
MPPRARDARLCPAFLLEAPAADASASSLRRSGPPARFPYFVLTVPFRPPSGGTGGVVTSEAQQARVQVSPRAPLLQ